MTVDELVAKWRLNPRCGVSIRDGWAPLVDALIESLVALGMDPAKDVAQIKEKLGGLRFYLETGTRPMFTVIDAAEEASFKTCEVCGAPGRIQPGDWIRVRCDACKEDK